MAGYDQPAYIHYRAGFKYQLSRSYKVNLPITQYCVEHGFFSLNLDGELFIKAGYAWDGPSGPTIDTKSFMRGSLVHDVLYQMIRLGLLPQSMRKKADMILRDLCIMDGMWRWRATFVYRAVRRFGAGAASPTHRKQEIAAP
jgi:hypothetical protein